MTHDADSYDEDDYVLVNIEEGEFVPTTRIHGYMVVNTGTRRMGINLTEFYLRKPEFIEHACDLLRRFQDEGVEIEAFAALGDIGGDLDDAA